MRRCRFSTPGIHHFDLCQGPPEGIARIQPTRRDHLADQFSEIFDGFSIGSNDLTQLILGVDRDSEIVAHVFDERNLAVKRMITSVIQIAHEKGRKIGICGQAPSDYPEFAEFLVRQGIDSMSLTADSVLRTTLQVLELERTLLEGTM